MLPFLVLLQACLWAPLTLALTNVSVGQSDPTISYTGRWDIQTDPMDVGGTHLLAEYDVQATAVFTFTGVAVYFMSPKWPYYVTTDISLDNGPVIRLDLQDHNHAATDGGFASIPSAPIPEAIWTGLDNGQHTLRITVPPGDNWAVLDNIIYTHLDASDPGGGGGSGSGTGSGSGSGSGSGNVSSTGSGGTGGTGTQTGSSSESTQSVVPVGSVSTKKSKTLAIALGIVCTLVGLAILLCLFLLFRRYQRRKREAEALKPINHGPDAVLGGTAGYPYRGPDVQPRGNTRGDPFADPANRSHPEPAFVAGGLVSQQHNAARKGQDADHDSTGSSGGPDRGIATSRDPERGYVPRGGRDPDVN